MFNFFIILLPIFFISIHAGTRVGIASDSNYCGERELGWRIKIAGESLGWTMVLDETRGKALCEKDDLDWIICLLPSNVYTSTHCPNFLTIFHPFNYLDANRVLLPFYEKYDGYLLTIKDKESVENSLKPKGRELYSITFYPTVQEVPFTEVALNNLVTMIPVWSNRLTDVKFKTLYNLLSQTGFARFYGIKRNAHVVREGYMGELPFDGASVIKILQKHGIVLIFHSDIHNSEGIPTGRIFEAAAASTVIISDENSFVKEHFGDSVFYVDTSLTSEGIFAQIQDHLDVIRSNPQKALDMAKTAHQIFIDNFLMSDQLIKLSELNDKIRIKSN